MSAREEYEKFRSIRDWTGLINVKIGEEYEETV
jgi:hypothetical protein